MDSKPPKGLVSQNATLYALITSRALYVCFVDLQKAYDTVQHVLLWGRLRLISVGPRMLAAIQSLYASGTLAMKMVDTAGPPLAPGQ